MKVLTQFEKKPLLFQNPRKIISCDNPESFSACFEEIEIALCSGFFVAGFFSYEAGYCFEETLHKDKQYDFPLVYLGVYDAPKRSNLVSKVKTSQSELNGLRLNITQKNYFKDIDTIRNYIAKGDVYQITYCIKLLAKFKGDPLALYERLLKEQPVPYPAYLETERFRILSLSPEMFIKKTGGFTSTKPMKGTWPRGTNLLSDFSRRVRFQFDKKNRAENVMIADLLRNDLGRIGLNVRAPRLFEVAGYRKLYQMTSTITAKLDKDLPIRELFASLFPSGSVTGAPKIRAMEIIRQLELEERKIYTGAIGYICPNRDLFFNIPIRTLLIEGENAEMGIGGGIVWDSTPGGEWSEGLLKARFVTDMARSNAGLL
ncbi:MAG: chorismate-binding protein [Candidatus Omnitrophica bacterium]|nr:chorismate-binding protein [Candidatus Omnitrophota bacterium]